MSLKSDIQIDVAKFQRSAITQKTNDFNDKLIKIMEGGPKWYEVGAPKYRQMRWNGETPLPQPTVLSHGKNSSFRSRDSGRSIPTRTFLPQSGAKPAGVFMHIHGGGWVLQSEAYQDTMLSYVADECNLAVVSVGYRLAPEDPFPAGNEDCFDAAEWLVDNASKEYGAPLLFVSGDSAGAHLSVLTCFELLKTRENFALKGLVLNFGAYDLAGFLPQAHNFDLPLVLDGDIMQKYIEAYLPGTTETQRRDPAISPLFADLSKLKKLPPALFTCGTLDCLLDDTVMMGSKWAIAGAETIIKIYPGAPHGFIFFPPGGCDETTKGLEDIKTFMTERTK